MSFLKSTVAVAALAVAFTASAIAAPIPGPASFDLVGAVTANGGATFDQATSLDFGEGPTFATFGTAGGTVELTGGINAIYTAAGFTAGVQGSVQDLASLTTGAKNINDFYRFTSGGNVLAFNLGTVTAIDRTAANPALSISPGIQVFATGSVFLTNYDLTPGVFSFSTTNTGAGFTATFQSSVNAVPAPVPEPASMALLGLGLAGLGLVRRRKA